MEIKTKVAGAVVMTDELASFLDQKIKKLEVFVKEDPTAICEVEVCTTSAGQRTGDVYRAEVHMTFTGGDVYAESIAATLHRAIDATVKEARRELRKKRTKNRDMVRKGAANVKEFFRNFGK